MATHSSVLAWRIPGTGEPGGLPSAVYGVEHSRTRLMRLSSSSSSVYMSIPVSQFIPSPPFPLGCCLVSHVRLFCDPMNCIAHQASLFMGFPRQEYWNALPCPPPGDFPYPGIKLTSSALAGGFFSTEPSGKAMKGSLTALILSSSPLPVVFSRVA